MEIPVQITFRNFSPSHAVEARIRKRALKLDHVFDRITACRVVVEAPHRRHHHGRLYHVRIDLTLPGGELVVNRDPHERHAHEDVYVAIRDAFDATQRQLNAYVTRLQAGPRPREGPPHGRVVRLFPEKGFGFLESADGREIYFHRNSVLNEGFDRLEIGAEVRFAEEPGEKGAQASTVARVGRGGRHLM